MSDETRGKRITNIGDQHVVVRRKHLHEMLRRLDLELSDQLWNEFERCGRYYVFDRSTWSTIAAYVRENYVGNGCDDWCENVCSGDDGCAFAGGTPGDCVAVCNNEEVYVQI